MPKTFPPSQHTQHPTEQHEQMAEQASPNTTTTDNRKDIPADKPRFDWMDYMRFFSAIYVLFFHYFFNGISNGKISSFSEHVLLKDFAKYGYLGVYFFFIISGFVISLSMQGRTVSQFTQSRILRLWPPFILCMTITTLTRLLSNNPEFAVSWKQYAANLTIIPQFFGEERIDGVYWTLTLEIWFYIYISMLIFIKLPLQRVVGLWLLLIVIWRLTPYRGIPIIGDNYIWFLIGSITYLITTQTKSTYNTLLLLVASSVALLEVGLASTQLSESRSVHYSPAVIVTTSAIFILLFATLANSRWRLQKLPLARQMGLITYPLYLLHAYCGYIILSIYGTESAKIEQSILVSIGMIIVSTAVVYWFEIPTKKHWKKLIEQLTNRALKIADKQSERFSIIIGSFRPK